MTCTAGEMGEVLVPELEHLAYEKDGGLGEHRRGELDAAMAVLGVADHRFLGGFGRFHDSGMAWHADGHAIPAESIPDNAFWNADLNEAADELVKVIREVRPQVLVTYDQFGGYGHPDHIQAHRVAMYAAQLAAAPSYKRRARRAARHREDLLDRDERVADAREPARAARVGRHRDLQGHGARRQAAAVRHARRAHLGARRRIGDRGPQDGGAAPARTQVEQDGHFFSGAESGHAWWSDEYYRLVKGTAGPVGDDGFEEDLFAGL